jgi:hypothetical protein
MARRRGIRIFVVLFSTVAIAYLLLSAGMYGAMLQPPDTFGRIMSHVPGPMMMVLPFPALWKVARGGNLRTGDEAPDFDLPAHDRASRVRLSSFRGSRPVVLVFGSYT